MCFLHMASVMISRSVYCAIVVLKIIVILTIETIQLVTTQTLPSASSKFEEELTKNYVVTMSTCLV